MRSGVLPACTIVPVFVRDRPAANARAASNKYMRWILCCIAALLLSLAGAYAVDGTFQGKVVDVPEGAPAIPGWIYIQGRNRLLPRVQFAQPVHLFSTPFLQNTLGPPNPR